MKRFKEIVFLCALSFTLLSLAFLFVLNAGASAFGAEASGGDTIKAFASDIANAGLFLFVYSVFIGVSFLIFDIKKLPAFWKRALHLVLNYVVMVVCFLAATSGHSRRALMVFVLSFVFIIVYFVGMALCRLLRKTEASLDEIKKSGK